MSLILISNSSTNFLIILQIINFCLPVVLFFMVSILVPWLQYLLISFEDIKVFWSFQLQLEVQSTFPQSPFMLFICFHLCLSHRKAFATVWWFLVFLLYLKVKWKDWLELLHLSMEFIYWWVLMGQGTGLGTVFPKYQLLESFCLEPFKFLQRSPPFCCQEVKILVSSILKKSWWFLPLKMKMSSTSLFSIGCLNSFL